MSSASEIEIEYPETDGQPMGETELHIEWTIRLRQLLKHRYRDQRVYVGSDLFIYFTKGMPTDVLAPDGFVVFDCDTHMRDVYKLWEENRIPNIAIEITSKAARRVDVTKKYEKHERVGIPEYFLYDPTQDHLDPGVVGYRLVGGFYQPIAWVDQMLQSQQLGISFALEGADLILIDTSTGDRLLTSGEASEARANAENAFRKQEQARADAEKSRADQLELQNTQERNARIAVEKRLAELEKKIRDRSS